MKPPKAFSYLRFSDPKQLRGDSLRRQVERSREYAELHGLELDETTTLRDLGISAFRGANREMGALAGFLEAVSKKRIPLGSYLLVESLDRLSRDQVRKALRPFLDIIDAGVTIVTLADGQVYNENTVSDGMQLMFSLIIMTRAHEESQTKSDRLTRAWVGKRLQIHDRKLTAKCPSWLRLSPNRDRFEPIPERVEIVQRILDEFVNGVGRGTIAKGLNEDGIPPFGHGTAWHGGTIQKITCNPALIGWFQPHTVRREYVEGPDGRAMLKEAREPTGELIKDYFPAVISVELFASASAVAAARSVKPGNAGGRKGSTFSNLFTGICRCASCGGRMTFRDRGRRSAPVLRCSRNVNGLCRNDQKFKYPELEHAVLDWLETEHFADIVPSSVDSELEREVSQTSFELKEVESRIERLIDAVEAGQPVVDRLKKRREQANLLREKLRALRRSLTSLHVCPDRLGRINAVSKLRTSMSLKTGRERYRVRAELAQTIQDVSNAMFTFHQTGQAEFHCMGITKAFRNGRLIVGFEKPSGIWAPPIQRFL